MALVGRAYGGVPLMDVIPWAFKGESMVVPHPLDLIPRTLR